MHPDTADQAGTQAGQRLKRKSWQDSNQPAQPETATNSALLTGVCTHAADSSPAARPPGSSGGSGSAARGLPAPVASRASSQALLASLAARAPPQPRAPGASAGFASAFRAPLPPTGRRTCDAAQPDKRLQPLHPALMASAALPGAGSAVRAAEQQAAAPVGHWPVPGAGAARPKRAALQHLAVRLAGLRPGLRLEADSVQGALHLAASLRLALPASRAAQQRSAQGGGAGEGQASVGTVLEVVAETFAAVEAVTAAVKGFQGRLRALKQGGASGAVMPGAAETGGEQGLGEQTLARAPGSGATPAVSGPQLLAALAQCANCLSSLQVAEHVLAAHLHKAASNLEALLSHHSAAATCWSQSQRLAAAGAARKRVLGAMLAVGPADEAGELVTLFHALRTCLAASLQAAAARQRADGEVRAAQGRLTAAALPRATPANLLANSLHPVVERQVRGLHTLLRLVAKLQAAIARRVSCLHGDMQAAWWQIPSMEDGQALGLASRVETVVKNIKGLLAGGLAAQLALPAAATPRQAATAALAAFARLPEPVRQRMLQAGASNSQALAQPPPALRLPHLPPPSRPTPTSGSQAARSGPPGSSAPVGLGPAFGRGPAQLAMPSRALPADEAWQAAARPPAVAAAPYGVRTSQGESPHPAAAVPSLQHEPSRARRTSASDAGFRPPLPPTGQGAQLLCRNVVGQAMLVCCRAVLAAVVSPALSSQDGTACCPAGSTIAPAPGEAAAAMAVAAAAAAAARQAGPGAGPGQAPALRGHHYYHHHQAQQQQPAQQQAQQQAQVRAQQQVQAQVQQAAQQQAQQAQAATALYQYQYQHLLPLLLAQQTAQAQAAAAEGPGASATPPQAALAQSSNRRPAAGWQPGSYEGQGQGPATAGAVAPADAQALSSWHLLAQYAALTRYLPPNQPGRHFGPQ